MDFNDSEMEEKEIEIMQEALERNVYPDYEDVVDLIGDILNWSAAYGEEDHECMEAIWCNITDRDVIERMGSNSMQGVASKQCKQTIIHCFMF